MPSDSDSKPFPFDRIAVDPQVMGGAPCVAGTRIPVDAIARLVAAGQTTAQVIADYPHLTPDDIDQAVAYARTYPPRTSNPEPVRRPPPPPPARAKFLGYVHPFTGVTRATTGGLGQLIFDWQSIEFSAAFLHVRYTRDQVLAIRISTRALQTQFTVIDLRNDESDVYYAVTNPDPVRAALESRGWPIHDAQTAGGLADPIRSIRQRLGHTFGFDNHH